MGNVLPAPTRPSVQLDPAHITAFHRRHRHLLDEPHEYCGAAKLEHAPAQDAEPQLELHCLMTDRTDRIPPNMLQIMRGVVPDADVYFHTHPRALAPPTIGCWPSAEDLVDLLYREPWSPPDLILTPCGVVVTRVVGRDRPPEISMLQFQLQVYDRLTAPRQDWTHERLKTFMADCGVRLEAFIVDADLPDDWRTTVRHQFAPDSTWRRGLLDMLAEERPPVKRNAWK